jgi:hypothetical protein
MPATKQRPRRLSDAQLEQLLALTTDANSVELNLTVPDSERRSTVTALAAGKRAIRKLYSKEHRTFFTAHAPDGIGLDDLSVLGPITVLKLKFSPEGYGRRLVAELCFYPDGSRILELSTKCAPTQGIQVAAETRAFLSSQGVDLLGEQQTKTKTALEYISRNADARSHGVAGFRQTARGSLSLIGPFLLGC